MRDNAIRRTITAVVELLIHILRNEVASINPKITLFQYSPTLLIIVSEIHLWKFDFSMATAMIKPPRNRKIILSENELPKASIGLTPVKGKSTSGNKSVAEIGIASVIHQIAIHDALANTETPSLESLSG